ncbi:MAG: hypothetical protein IT172_08400 [Acidobacteria bacterium]|nr:hypothetical protein [Acidobacteriota bacterium]
MNSEELEQSLRAEFETYLNGVAAKMRDDAAEFQTKIRSQLDEHRARFDDIIEEFTERFDGKHEFDAAFSESVTEHLRLARDEGATITAAAIAEAEALEKEAVPEADFGGIRDAIKDISSKQSQSAILKTLIEHAANYAPRGAFFIVKAEHFVGWKVFGKEASANEEAVRDISIPITADTILAKAAASLATVEGNAGAFADDADILGRLEYGTPDRMYAIPLIARGRTVAVMYADYGHEGIALNTDALETLVHVAGVTVELLAANRSAHAVTGAAPATAYDDPSIHALDTTEEPAQADTPRVFVEPPPFEGYRPSEAAFDDADRGESAEHTEEPAAETHFEAPSFRAEPVAAAEEPKYGEFEPNAAVEQVEEPVYGASYEVKAAEPVTEAGLETSPFGSHAVDEPAVKAEVKYDSFEPSVPVEHFEGHEADARIDVETSTFEPQEPSHSEYVEPAAEYTVPAAEFEPEPEAAAEEPAEEPAEPAVEEPEEPATAEPAFVFESNFDRQNPYENEPYHGDSFAQPEPMPAAAPEPAVATATVAPQRSRLSDRNVDLPIEVPEDERRLHNDARRFARLLVSEIKLYNEQKVREGRESHDLYVRLKEAIDRSREMYDKRVQPPVAAKFDYFHYEIVNSLGEGDESRLGLGYPGSAV